MGERGSTKKERRNPNDPARFLGSIAVTDDGEKANVHNFLNTDKIDEEAKYDGMYAISTDLLDDDVSEILSISEKRWQIEECFRIMKTEFEARPGWKHFYLNKFQDGLKINVFLLFQKTKFHLI